ncbi:MAG: T9SS type A sorting domain-containing protein [Crocinitomix sp.]|nr:T9SS type A sorting domain-containing protein [Crocinitomix sp.]
MKALVLLVALFFAVNVAQAQKIYGFSGVAFGSLDLADHSVDTLFVMPSELTWDGFTRVAIDRYNGRYFYGGTLPGHSGRFHIIDLVDFTVSSFSDYPETMTYDCIGDRIIYEKSGTIKAIDLETMNSTILTEIPNAGASIFGDKRTYIPQTNQFFYMESIHDPESETYYLSIDVGTGEITCSEIVEYVDGVMYSPGFIVTNHQTGDVIGRRNGRFGFIDPCAGTISKLASISGYHSNLNYQLSVFNHKTNYYIVPFRSVHPGHPNQIAVIDVYANEVIEIFDQPWEGTMNLQQIYDKPTPPLISINDTLFVPKGLSYSWYRNDNFIETTSENYWVPKQSGKYRAEVEFREYTSMTNELTFNFMPPVAEINRSEITRVFPNPVSKIMTIEFPDTTVTSIRVIDSKGKVHFQLDKVAAFEIDIDMSVFPRGNYFIEIIKEDQTEVHSIIKQ